MIVLIDLTIISSSDIFYRQKPRRSEAEFGQRTSS